MFRRRIKKEPYDKAKERPVIHASICNGEQVAGFKDIESGKFREVMLLRDRNDLDLFLEKYDVKESEIVKEY